MAPYSSVQRVPSHLLSRENKNESDVNGDVKDECDKVEDKNIPDGSSEELPPLQIIWMWVFVQGVLHVVGMYGLYLMLTSAMWQTNVFAIVFDRMGCIGITAGVHRLWTHRTYKARLPLRIFLSLLYTSTFQFSIYHWVRDHRVHHMYSETNADPHNAKRGFFFSHIGWLLTKRQKDCLKKLKTIDMSDLWADPVVRFNYDYYNILVILCCFVLPTVIPMWLWGDTLSNAFFVAACLRFIVTLHSTFLVNSAAHMWGSRPYDINIDPAENFIVSILATGEGFHNYHHTFPWDYSTSEFGMKYNITTAFIDTMAWLGLAYDRKTASKSVIEARKLRTGDL